LVLLWFLQLTPQNAYFWSQARLPHRCVAKIGIADARKRASRIMFQVAGGTDPQAIKRAARSAGTFDDIADRYL
jgi:hypothetical protein